eukprot:4527976-Amphidinium_carterae.1
MAMRLLLTISIVKGYAVYTTDVASAFLNTAISEEIFVQPPASEDCSCTLTGVLQARLLVKTPCPLVQLLTVQGVAQQSRGIALVRDGMCAASFSHRAGHAEAGSTMRCIVQAIPTGLSAHL